MNRGPFGSTEIKGYTVENPALFITDGVGYFG